MARPRGTWAEKQFRDALSMAVKVEGPNGVRRLRAIAEQLVAAALDGDIAAIKEVADRLDGRPAQALTVGTHVTHDAASLSDADLAAIIAGREGEDATPGTKH